MGAFSNAMLEADDMYERGISSEHQEVETLVISRVYEDRTIRVLNLEDGNESRVKHHTLIGKHVYGFSNRLEDCFTCSVLRFPTEYEYKQYVCEHGEPIGRVDFDECIVAIYRDIRSEISKVPCYVYATRGNETLYRAEKGIVPYVQAAKEFGYTQAKKLASALTVNNKHGMYWKVQPINKI